MIFHHMILLELGRIIINRVRIVLKLFYYFSQVHIIDKYTDHRK